jgi:hypothetical protein
MVISSPPVVLAAVAEATERIRLSPATTLLNTLDPVRVFEDFATLDLLSGGRVELLVGRGSFTESFALFGHDIADYEALFAERLELLMRINANERVTWSGRLRAPLVDAEVSPRPEQPLPIWIGVGGTPEEDEGKVDLKQTVGLALQGTEGGLWKAEVTLDGSRDFAPESLELTLGGVKGWGLTASQAGLLPDRRASSSKSSSVRRLEWPSFK